MLTCTSWSQPAKESSGSVEPGFLPKVTSVLNRPDGSTLLTWEVSTVPCWPSSLGHERVLVQPAGEAVRLTVGERRRTG